MDSLGFLHGEVASASKLKSFLPFSLPQKDLTSRAIITKLKFVHKRVNASPVCDPALHAELLSECITEVRSTSTSPSSMLSPNLSSERGVFFSTGPSFFRPQSSLARDLAVLAAALYKRSQGRLRVLDVMSGCGVRALRYLTQSEADFVVANDCNKDLHNIIVENLSRYAPLQGLHCPPEPVSLPLTSHNQKEPFRSEGPSSGVGNSNRQELESTGTSSSQEMYLSVNEGSFDSYGSPATQDIPNVACPSTEKPNIAGGAEDNHCEHNKSSATDSDSSMNSCFGGPLPHANTRQDFEGGRSSSCIKWQVRHEEAARLLTRCNLDMDFYDFVDVDSFGSDSLIGPALSALRFGGLLFITCTDGFSSGGHRPYNSLAQYGTFMKPMPYSNELGLRMLTGAAIKEGALRNMTVSPIFSVYAPHGPVFRVLLRAGPGKLNKDMLYRFIYYCRKCGDSRVVDWECLGTTCCPCSEKVSDSIKMSGPLWTGPLHNAKDIQDMIALAREWGWISDVPEAESLHSSSGDRRKKKQEKLLEILNLMLEESHPELHFGFKHLDEIAKRGKIQTPRREKFIQALRTEGYIVSRSHVCANSVKTNCSMTSCIALAKKLAETGF